MQWYEGIIDKLELSRTYSHKELLELLKNIKQDLWQWLCHWFLIRQYGRISLLRIA